jgi:hypothetical protein
MKLNLVDKITLLAIDDHNGKFLADSFIYPSAVAGAVIAEFFLLDKVELDGKKLVVVDDSMIGEELLDSYFNLIANSHRDKKLTDWVYKLYNKGKETKKYTLNKLCKSGILTEKEDTFLWFFQTNKYPTQDVFPEAKIKKRLNDIIINGAEAKQPEIMLIGLMEACDLSAEVLGKTQAKEQKKRIKALIDSDILSKKINKAIKDVRDMLFVAVTV